MEKLKIYIFLIILLLISPAFALKIEIESYSLDENTKSKIINSFKDSETSVYFSDSTCTKDYCVRCNLGEYEQLIKISSIDGAVSIYKTDIGNDIKDSEIFDILNNINTNNEEEAILYATNRIAEIGKNTDIVGGFSNTISKIIDILTLGFFAESSDSTKSNDHIRANEEQLAKNNYFTGDVISAVKDPLDSILELDIVKIEEEDWSAFQSAIDKYLDKYAKRLKPYGKKFIEESKLWGVDPRFVVAVAVHSTPNENNLYGLISYIGDEKEIRSFTNIEESIEAFVSTVHEKISYCKQNTLKKFTCISGIPASDPYFDCSSSCYCKGDTKKSCQGDDKKWVDDIAKTMKDIDSYVVKKISSPKNSYSSYISYSDETICERDSVIPNEYRIPFSKASKQFGIDTNFLASIFKCGENHAGISSNAQDNFKKSWPAISQQDTSGSGAMGPFQFMPATWSGYKEDCGGGGDAYSIYDSSCAAAKFLKNLLNGKECRYKSGKSKEWSAAACYNGGYNGAVNELSTPNTVETTWKYANRVEKCFSYLNKRKELAMTRQSPVSLSSDGSIDKSYFRSDYQGRTRTDIKKIVIHTCESGINSCLNALSKGDTASHYVISNNGLVYQIVDDSKVAVHADYSSDEYGINQESIGIEHEGYADNTNTWRVNGGKWNKMAYASAKLVANLAKKYNIPIDNTHIVPHGSTVGGCKNLQFINKGKGSYCGVWPSIDRHDPGKYWYWEDYLELVKNS